MRRLCRGVACAALGLFASTAAADPPQAWAHRSGLVQLQENGRRLEHDTPEDRLAIMEAFARWGIAYDEGQTRVIETLFTDDASYMVTEGSSVAQVSLLGRDAIVAGVTRALLQQGDQRRHAISNVVIDRMDQSSASAIAYGIVTVARDDTLSLGATVIYSAELERGADGTWRFSRFVIGMDNYVGVRPRL